MVRSLIVLFPLAAASAIPSETGFWTRSTGQIVEMPCPTAFEEGGRVRLPRTCESFEAGVLLTSDAYREQRVLIAELEAKIMELQTENALLSDRINTLSAQDPVACPTDLWWVYVPIGVLAGVGLSHAF